MSYKDIRRAENLGPGPKPLPLWFKLLWITFWLGTAITLFAIL